MKKTSLIFLLIVSKSFCQGKYAAEYSTLLQKKYSNEKELIELKNFRYQEGKVLGEINTNGLFSSTLEVFKKGSTAIVILSKLTNPKTKIKTIIEVIKLSNITKNQEIRISSCSRKNPYPNEEIVVVMAANTNQLKIAQAYALQDIRFEKTPIKGIKCVLNEMN